jgi:hypothetical protein
MGLLVGRFPGGVRSITKGFRRCLFLARIEVLRRGKRRKGCFPVENEENRILLAGLRPKRDHDIFRGLSRGR